MKKSWVFKKMDSMVFVSLEDRKNLIKKDFKRMKCLNIKSHFILRKEFPWFIENHSFYPNFQSQLNFFSFFIKKGSQKVFMKIKFKLKNHL